MTTIKFKSQYKKCFRNHELSFKVDATYKDTDGQIKCIVCEV